MKTKINLEKTKSSLVSKVFLSFAIAMLCFNIASFSTSVTVHNNTDCTMQIYCDDNGRTYDMGTLYAGKRKTIDLEVNYGHMYCRNKDTGSYAKGLNFNYGHYDLYVDRGCHRDDDDNDDPETPDNTPQCDDPTYNPCSNVNVLDFTQDGINWDLNDMGGSYTVGEQTFDISINDEDGIFAAFQEVQADPDDEGSYENNTGIAVGINPHNTDDEIEINYNLSLISDNVAFTIRDLDKKYYSGSQQIEEVCVYGYLDGVEILPTITSLCGSVDVSGNCAVGTADSADGKDESIRIVFETCINEIRIVYGNASDAANDPTYSRIFIGDDIGFGTAVCTDDCIPCTAEDSEVNTDDSLICLGLDGTVTIDEGFVSLVNAGNGENSAWVITNEFAEVLQVSAELPVVLNGVGSYKFWYVNWDGDLSGPLDPGVNAAEVANNSECVALGSPGNLNVIECCTAENSEIELVGSANSICVDDDLDEPIDVQVIGGSGENSAWVITDENLNIVGLPDGGPPFILDGAGVGICSIWYLNWDGDLANTPMIGMNAGDLVNNSFCAKLSNPIAITRENCCTAENSEIELVGSSNVICVDDGVDEPIDVQVNGGSGENSAWVITDENLNIVGLPDGDPPFILDAAGVGICSIWYLNWDGDLANMPMIGMNAGDLVNNSFCAKLSNPIAITRQNCCTAENSEIELVGSNNVICVDDGVDEPIDVQVNGGSGENSAWVITDENRNIIDLPAGDPPFVLDGAGVGTCLIWYLNWDGDLSPAPAIDLNADQIITDSFCAKLSNPITITRENCCTAENSEIELVGSDNSICVDDDLDEPIDVQVIGGSGENSAWVITDENLNIVGLPDGGPPFILDAAGVGICSIWYLNWDGDLANMPMIGMNAGDLVNNSFCAKLSNPIAITRENCCTAAPAEVTIEGGSTTLDVCVNSEDLTTINFNLVNPGSGDTSVWVITDENSIIDSVSSVAPSLDLYGSELGTMQIWYLNWDGDLSAAPDVGADVGAIVENSECAALSAPVIIIKDCCCPYSFVFTEDNTICPANTLILRPIVVEDESLVLDNGEVICDVLSCSDDPKILDSTGSEAPNQITAPGDYTAQLNCSCAPDATLTVTQELIDECINGLLFGASSVIDITENSATVSYYSEGTATVEYRKTGDDTFIGFNSDLGLVFLTDLEACTSYEYRTKTFDTNGRALVSEIQSFTTIGCRNININDVNLRSLDVRTTSAILSWDNMSGCIYTLYYRVEGDTEWRTYDTSIPFVALFGLNPCTNYEWALRVSDEEAISDVSATQLISTTCQGPRISNPNASDVKIGDLTDLKNIELNLFVNYATATLNINYMGLPVNGVKIYSTNGQLVKDLNINNTGLNSIDVNSLDAGVYILVSNIDGELAKNKFVINK